MGTEATEASGTPRPGLSWLTGALGMLAAIPAAAQPPCDLEPALARAAERLVADGRGAPSGRGLQRVVRAAGSELVGARALWLPVADGGAPGLSFEGRTGVVGRWLVKQRDRVSLPLVCGWATGTHGTLLIAAPRRARLRWARGKLVGELAERYGTPWLAIERADGTLLAQRVTRQSLGKGIEVSAARRVQLMAYGPSGPEPVAELRLYPADAASPPRDAAEELATASRGDAQPEPTWAREAWHLLHRVRGAGAGRLRPNRLLQEAAEAHARAVCALEQASHVLPDGQDPVRRLAETGLAARHLGETVARAASVDVAWRALIDSPSHRLALTDARFTDAGIGVARDAQQRACLVVLLASWPRPLVR